MKDLWRGLRAILVKDIAVELRARQVLPTMVVLGMLIVFILRMASESGSASAGAPVMGAAALWIAFLFSAAVQLTRTRGSLLSIVVLVILMPMMIPASFALLVLFGAMPDHAAGSSPFAFVGSFHAAVGYMLAFDAVFVVACWLLFGIVVEE